MTYNKSYRMVYLTKLALEKGYLSVTDWEDLDLCYDSNRKTITRDIAELKDLLYDIYSYRMVYDNRNKEYQLIDLDGRLKNEVY